LWLCACSQLCHEGIAWSPSQRLCGPSGAAGGSFWALSFESLPSPPGDARLVFTQLLPFQKQSAPSISFVLAAPSFTLITNSEKIVHYTPPAIAKRIETSEEPTRPFSTYISSCRRSLHPFASSTSQSCRDVEPRLLLAAPIPPEFLWPTTRRIPTAAIRSSSGLLPARTTSHAISTRTTTTSRRKTEKRQRLP